MPKRKDVAIWVAIVLGGIVSFLMYGWAAEVTR